MNFHKLSVLALTLAVAGSTAATAPAASADTSVTARLLASRLKWRKGIALDVGPGDASLAAEIARHTELMIHCVDPERKHVVGLRARLDAAGLYGKRVVVHQGRLDQLDFPSLSANLVFAGDEWVDGPRGRSAGELYRVLSPNGIAVVGQSPAAAGKSAAALTRERLEQWLRAGGVTSYEIVEENGLWAFITREPSPGWDDWTHRNHDPANTLASQDQIPYATYRPQWISDYRPGLASASVALAGGRVIVAGLSYPQQPDTTPYLQVLDAFSGIELWARVGKKELPIDRPPGMYSNREFCSDYAVAGDTLYLLGGKFCHVIDLADGAIRQSIPVPAGAGDAQKDNVWLYLSCVGDTLFAGVGPSPNVRVDWNSMNYRGRCSAVFALERKTGQVKWLEKTPAVTASLSVHQGKLFYCDDKLGLHALDAGTGAEVWSQGSGLPEGSEVAGCAVYRGKLWVMYNRPMKGRRGGLATGAALLQAGHNAREVVAFATRDGGRLFDCDFGITVAGFTFSGDTIYGARQHSSGLAAVDVETGKRRWLQTKWNLKCTASVATPSCLLYRSTETAILDLASMKASSESKPQVTEFGGFRPTCTYAAIPANGMLYIQAPGCRCPSPIRGSMALRPDAEPVPISPDDRLVKGEAFGLPVKEDSATPVWASWRADRFRSGQSPEEVRLPLNRLWIQQLSPGLTPSCAGHGLVFIAAGGKLLASDVRTGEKKWQYLAGAAIQAAPYLWQGRLYVGDEDGWVHCLRAEDGQCVWRFHAALARDRAVGYGRYASLWPVASGVVVHDGTAYFAAGLLPNEGTLVHAVDARTGSARWQQLTNQDTFNYRSGFIPGGPAAMSEQKLYFPTREAAPWQIDLSTPGHRPQASSPILFGSRRGGPQIMVGTDGLISVTEGRQYVWHVKYVVEDTSQRLPILGKDRIFLLNQRSKGGPCLAAVTPKEGSPATSKMLWTAWKGTPMNVMIQVGEVLFSGGADKVYATRASDGGELWSAAVPGEVVDLSYAGGRLFVACRSGELLCFGAAAE